MQDLAHRVDGLRVEARERLVQYQEDRAEDQGRGQLDMLLVPMAELLQVIPPPVGKAEAGEPRLD